MFFWQDEYYGVDWDGPAPENNEDNLVDVPCTACPLNEDSYRLLQTTINPEQHSNEWGVDIYHDVLTFIHQQNAVNNL